MWLWLKLWEVLISWDPRMAMAGHLNPATNRLGLGFQPTAPNGDLHQMNRIAVRMHSYIQMHVWHVCMYRILQDYDKHMYNYVYIYIHTHASMSLQSKYMITIESLYLYIYKVPPRNLCFQRFCWPFYSFWGCLFAILLLLPPLPLLLTLVSRRQCGKQVCQGGGHSREVIAISHVRIQCWVESRPWAFAWNLSFVLAFVLLNFVQSRGMFRKHFLHCLIFFFPYITWTNGKVLFQAPHFLQSMRLFWGHVLLQFPTSLGVSSFFFLQQEARWSSSFRHPCQATVQPWVSKSLPIPSLQELSPPKNGSSCAHGEKEGTAAGGSYTWTSKITKHVERGELLQPLQQWRNWSHAGDELRNKEKIARMCTVLCTCQANKHKANKSITQTCWKT